MFVYYIDGKKFTTKKINKIPDNVISTPDENTPALENLLNGFKIWCLKGDIFHRLNGPAVIRSDGTKEFYLNGKYYGKNIHDWLKHHPNQDNTFQVEMLLKYT
jgi:hypothetical protein